MTGGRSAEAFALRRAFTLRGAFEERWAFMVWGALALLLFATAPGCRRTAAPPEPAARNIVLITIDTLRADHVGAYGYARARTPAIDRLASLGVRFEHAYAAAPITLPSHATMLT